MEKDKAIEALKELIRCENDLTKQSNFRAGGVTKKLLAEERRAVQVLFQGLVGHTAEPAELDEIIGG
jgi:hypothetical protein